MHTSMHYVLRFALVLVFLSTSGIAHAGSISVDVSHKDRHSPGDIIRVEWVGEDLPDGVPLAIYLSSIEEGFLYPIARSVPQSGTFRWEIPESTAAARDYRISLSTEDKGPSVSSPYSQPFEITGGDDGFAITEAYTRVVEDKAGMGEVTLYFETNRPLDKSHYLRLNINCPDEVSITSPLSAKTSCKSWVGIDDRDGAYELAYEVLSTEPQWLAFTIDLMRGETLLQRVFVDRVLLSGLEELRGSLRLTLDPSSEVAHNEELIIRFWDVDADEYRVSAVCKADLQMAGKARPDLCIEAEVLGGGGKDVLRVDHIYPYNRSGMAHAARIYVEAFAGGELVARDSEAITVLPKGGVSDTPEPRLDKPVPPQESKPEKPKRSTEEVLALVEELFGKESDAYLIVQLFIALGIIE